MKPQDREKELEEKIEDKVINHIRNQKQQTKFGKYFAYVPFVMMAVFVVLVIIFRKDITVDNILNFAPKNEFLAALFIFAFFVFKGLSIMFPGTVIYVLTGTIFSPVTAMIVAIIGTIIEIMETYLLGVLCGETKMITKLMAKPKFKKLFASDNKNEGMLVYLSRIIGLPYDVMGMFWGTVGAKFIPYTIFSMLGKLPKVVVETLIGTAVNNHFSKKSIIVFVVLTLATLLITIISTKLGNKKSDNSNNNDVKA